MKTFAAYLLIGAGNTGLTLGVIYVLISHTGIHHVLANFCGYVAGIISSFWLNRRFTFESTGKWNWQLLGFLATFGTSYLISLGALLALVRVDIFPYWLNTIASLGTYTVASFFLNKHLVFNRPQKHQ